MVARRQLLEAVHAPAGGTFLKTVRTNTSTIDVKAEAPGRNRHRAICQ